MWERVGRGMKMKPRGDKKSEPSELRAMPSAGAARNWAKVQLDALRTECYGANRARVQVTAKDLQIRNAPNLIEIRR